jgi:hypothetical protein
MRNKGIITMPVQTRSQTAYKRTAASLSTKKTFVHWFRAHLADAENSHSRLEKEVITRNMCLVVVEIFETQPDFTKKHLKDLPTVVLKKLVEFYSLNHCKWAQPLIEKMEKLGYGGN